jgi:hypothetical protein
MCASIHARIHTYIMQRQIHTFFMYMQDPYLVTHTHKHTSTHKHTHTHSGCRNKHRYGDQSSSHVMQTYTTCARTHTHAHARTHAHTRTHTHTHTLTVGAMIITGVESNPMTMLCKQLDLSTMVIKPECKLYDVWGLVPEESDTKVSSRVCMLSYMYVCVHACMDVCLRVCMYVSFHTCMYACMYVCMYVCVRVCMYVCFHTCMYVCMYEFNLRTLAIKPECKLHDAWGLVPEESDTKFSIRVCMLSYYRKCVCVCVYIYIYIHEYI